MDLKSGMNIWGSSSILIYRDRRTKNSREKSLRHIWCQKRKLQTYMPPWRCLKLQYHGDFCLFSFMHTLVSGLLCRSSILIWLVYMMVRRDTLIFFCMKLTSFSNTNCRRWNSFTTYFHYFIKDYVLQDIQVFLLILGNLLQ